MELSVVIETLENGDKQKIQEMIQESLDEGMKAYEIVNEKLIAAMNDIGKRFRENILFVPEVLIAARTMNSALEMLAPYLSAGEAISKGKVLLGTVKDDLHDIGKNLVGMMFKSGGFEVIDIGIDVPMEKFIEGVKEHKPDILAMSALLTNTLHQMEVVIQGLERENLREQVIVMVGGAPVSEEFAKSIGADGFAPDAASAVEVARKLLGAKN
ncbi:cobalamin B12-binding domain-containing protein [Desulfoscipio geothermicus]|uniref:5-methyltetrahydrofolate--homocysteine methyltransferase n=1 Tax=Desulfoscipio geothermicus DSM 3669 TaxID=1121426 RepID=A0A1I6DEK3_9FIRM|nr:corrinoid protein [Desulfoscipio geothermicus]SFR03889.1 5-methyltetrahydrofolate--homocysteine methyltransferase [Desulfoscipio geothermicus DSM 3669]